MICLQNLKNCKGNLVTSHWLIIFYNDSPNTYPYSQSSRVTVQHKSSAAQGKRKYKQETAEKDTYVIYCIQQSSTSNQPAFTKMYCQYYEESNIQ